MTMTIRELLERIGDLPAWPLAIPFALGGAGLLFRLLGDWKVSLTIGKDRRD